MISFVHLSTFFFTVNDRMRNCSVDTCNSQMSYHRVKILTVSSVSFAVCLISSLVIICILRLIHFTCFLSFSLESYLIAYRNSN